MTSQARIDANRQNAKNSTGPRTAAGKEKTRLNGLKHGLCSDEVVLPTEDRQVFEGQLAAWMDDWQPTTETRRFLVERAATAAWRISRCVRNETDRLADRINRGFALWDKTRSEQVERAFKRLPQDPQASVEDLMSTHDGVQFLICVWNGLHNAIDDPEGWWDCETHHDRLCYLLGINGENDPDHLLQVSRASLGLMIRALPDVYHPDIKPLDDAMAARVRAMLGDICGAKVEELVAHIQTLPDESMARQRFAEMKAFEPHLEDAIYGRYEARIDREARAAIAQLIRLHQTGADLAALDEPELPSEPIAVALEQPAEANKPAPKAIVPSEPNPVPAQGLISHVDRDRGGRIWGSEADGDRPEAIGMPHLHQ